MRRTSAKLMPSRCSSYVQPHAHGGGVLRLATMPSFSGVATAAHTLVRDAHETRAKRRCVDDRELHLVGRELRYRIGRAVHEHVGSAANKQAPAKLTLCPRACRVEHRRATNLLRIL